MKRCVAIILCMLLILSTGSTVLADNTVTVKLNGNELYSDVPPQLINGRTMVPLRAIFEALGATVYWHESTQSITAIKGNTMIECAIGSYTMTVNDVQKSIDVPPMMLSDRTLVPARFIAEAFGCHVAWDESRNTVTITSGDGDYYPGTSIPNFTSVTGVSSSTTETAESGTVYNLYEISRIEDITDYIEALEDAGFVSSFSEDENGEITEGFEKGNELVMMMLTIDGKAIDNRIVIGYTTEWDSGSTTVSSGCSICAKNGQSRCQGHLCSVCNGQGSLTCNGCHGTGLPSVPTKYTTKCVVCYGMGTQICPNCDGARKLFYDN